MVRVGEANISITRQQAFVDCRPVPLGSRAFEVLEKLMATPNKVVLKHELLAAVWPNVCIEEKNLTVQIHNLRKLLKLDRKTLETVHHRGYRLNIECADPDNGARPAPDNGAQAFLQHYLHQA